MFQLTIFHEHSLVRIEEIQRGFLASDFYSDMLLHTWKIYKMMNKLSSFLIDLLHSFVVYQSFSICWWSQNNRAKYGGCGREAETN